MTDQGPGFQRVSMGRCEMMDRNNIRLKIQPKGHADARVYKMAGQRRTRFFDGALDRFVHHTAGHQGRASTYGCYLVLDDHP